MGTAKPEDKVPDVPTDDDTNWCAGDPPEVGGGGEEGKLKVLLGLLKKLVGVKDVANLRLSLPASLLEPIPNLEYWQYADRADIFAAIGDSHDELERMLAVLRFSFSKELKFVRARLGKPYNSALGEETNPTRPIPRSDPQTNAFNRVQASTSDARGASLPSIRSESSKASKKPAMRKSASKEKVFDLSALSRAIPGPGDEIEGDPDSGVVESEKVTVVFLCEQVSHHPPISAAYYCCPERGIEAVGMDQIVARVSGMSVKLGPGPINKGIFVRINREGPGKGEEYQITHPSAQVNGIIKGAYYGTISDQISVTCRGGDGKVKLRTLLDYKDESWIGKPRFLFDGVIYKYEEGNAEHEAWSKAKHVPADRVVANLEGNWMKEVRYRLKGEKDWRILLDLDQLALIPKMVRPLEEQEPSESRKLWDPVTQMLLTKNWGRLRGRSRYLPRFFETEWDNGRPVLSEAGIKAIEEEHQRVNGAVSASGAEPSGTPTPVASSASSQVRV
ncbi:hypothetical protein EHS25_008897 [Saitozyma podzolica]|uniref:Oxysterol binding protein n=1 Tax=Saitozyma podzolica TaxID=1890683 RepID=A0A427YN56_9TREE|nr:hypothetical protein EHS25_008897 [Saitozyma podzolica]